MAAELVVKWKADTAVALGTRTLQRSAGQEDILPAGMARQLERGGVLTVLGTLAEMSAARALPAVDVPDTTAPSQQQAADSPEAGGVTEGPGPGGEAAEQQPGPAEQADRPAPRRRRRRKPLPLDERHLHSTRDTVAGDGQEQE